MKNGDIRLLILLLDIIRYYLFIKYMKESLSSMPFFAFVNIILMQKKKVVEKIKLKWCYLATYMYLIVCRKLCSVDLVAGSIFKTI